MMKFVARRFARMVFVLVVTTFGALVAVTEWGDPFKMIGPRMQTPEARAILNETFGLDQPLIIRYLRFLGNLAVGDLGVDFERRRPVFDQLAAAAPNTFRLALVALAIQVVLVITIIPLFVIGIVLRNTLSGVSVFGWEAFPLIPRSLGVETTWLQDLVLPALTLGVGALAYTVVLARGAMLDVLAADYIRTARAKGLTERKILFKHAARNAMIPVAELSAILVRLPGT